MSTKILALVVCVAAAPAGASQGDCTASAEVLARWQGNFEAHVVIVDARGRIEQAAFPWLRRRIDSARTLDVSYVNSSSTLKLTGFGWRTSPDSGAAPVPGTSRRLSIAQERRALRVSIAEPGAVAPSSAHVTCRDGIWSGLADDSNAWIRLRLRALPEPGAIRRAGVTR